MTIPPPRDNSGAAADTHSLVTREEFVAAFEAMYDRLRECSLAQLEHAILMARRQLGGVVIFQLPSKQAKRTRAEVAYMSELPEGVRVG